MSGPHMPGAGGIPDVQEMAQLLVLPAFRRFLWRVSRDAGILQSAYGTDGRDLAFREGRRSLGFDILRMAEDGQPFPHALAAQTLRAVLAEEEKSHLETQTHDRRRTSRHDRYGNAPDGSGDA